MSKFHARAFIIIILHKMLCDPCTDNLSHARNDHLLHILHTQERQKCLVKMSNQITIYEIFLYDLNIHARPYR